MTVIEGNNVLRAASFTVTLSKSWDEPFTVAYATANGSAAASSDYQAASGTLTILAAQTIGTITVLVNGDITSIDEVDTALTQSGADGVMIGRGAYGRPWFLSQVIAYLRTGERVADPPLHRQLAIVLKHYEAILTHYGIATGLRMARKHLGWYSRGLHGAADFRGEINRRDDPRQVMEMLRAFYEPQIERQAA